MPSLDELTNAGIEVGFDGPAAPADVLARVKAEGLRRRGRRYRRNSLVAVLGLAALALPAVAFLPGDDDADDVRVAGETETAPPTTADLPDVTVPTTIAVSVPPTTAAAPADAEPEVDLGPASVYERPEPTPTTVATPPAPVCQNSTDPACGDFYWDPAPAENQPVTAAFVDVPQTVTAGEAVTLTVAWSDPDAGFAWDHFSPDGVGVGGGCTAEPRHGPWTPPEPAPGSGERSYTHTFAEPGTYTVVVSLATGDCSGPYYSEAHPEVTITVV